MSNLFIICCIAIIVFQAVLVILRFSLRKLRDTNHTVIFNCIQGALLILLLVVRFVPQVSDRIVNALLPGIVELWPRYFAYLIMILLLTCLPRMLLEHFVLKMPYKRSEWIMFGAFILLTVFLFRTILF